MIISFPVLYFTKKKRNRINRNIDVVSQHVLVNKTNDNWPHPAIAAQGFPVNQDGKYVSLTRVEKITNRPDITIGFTSSATPYSTQGGCAGNGMNGLCLDLFAGRLMGGNGGANQIWNRRYLDANITRNAKEVITILTVKNNGDNTSIKIQFIVDGICGDVHECEEEHFENGGDEIFPVVSLLSRDQKLEFISFDQVQSLSFEIDELMKKFNISRFLFAPSTSTAENDALISQLHDRIAQSQDALIQAKDKQVKEVRDCFEKQFTEISRHHHQQLTAKDQQLAAKDQLLSELNRHLLQQFAAKDQQLSAKDQQLSELSRLLLQQFDAKDQQLLSSASSTSTVENDVLISHSRDRVSQFQGALIQEKDKQLKEMREVFEKHLASKDQQFSDANRLHHQQLTAKDQQLSNKDQQLCDMSRMHHQQLNLNGQELHLERAKHEETKNHLHQMKHEKLHVEIYYLKLLHEYEKKEEEEHNEEEQEAEEAEEDEEAKKEDDEEEQKQQQQEKNEEKEEKERTEKKSTKTTISNFISSLLFPNKNIFFTE